MNETSGIAADTAQAHQLLNGNGHVGPGTIEPWLWEAACSIRGAVDAPKYRDYILPLIFLKRLSDVYEDELERLAEQFGDADTARELAANDRDLVRFYLPEDCMWPAISRLTEHVGQRLTEIFRTVGQLNPDLQGVIDVIDFNATISGQRIVDDIRLLRLITVLSRHRLGLADVEPDVLGRAYEYLLRKFAEGQGQSAGEFFTPKEVGWLMAKLVRPQPGERFHDPAAGSSGLLIKSQLLLMHEHGPTVRPLQLHAQELLHPTYALSRMNLFLHDLTGRVELGDTLRQPRFTNDDGSLEHFDVVMANPMWNQDGYDAAFYEGDDHDRFTFGTPPANTADWGWLQHMLAVLDETGRAAVVLDTNAVNRGSGASGRNRERDLRKAIVEANLVEGVILLPENLFYNTGSPGIIVLLNKNKPNEREDQVILINASQEFEKGAPKNILPLDAVDRIATAFHDAQPVDGFVRLLSIEEIRDFDYDLSPGRHVVPPIKQRDLTLLQAADELAAAEREHASAVERREGLLALYSEIAEEELRGTSKLGPIPEDWTMVPLAEFVTDEFSGDWGEGAPAEGYSACRVIKGTNFADVEEGRIDDLVVRYVRDRALARKRIQEGDLLVEMSGGGKYQATGRVLYITDDLVAADNPPIHYVNFTRLLRLDRERVDPRFVYHFWRLLYRLGRTQPHERQPTQIRNFKAANFLAEELIPELEIDQQSDLAAALDALERETHILRERIKRVEALHGTAAFDLLTGFAQRRD